MLTVRSEIGPYQKPPRDFYREASHAAKAPSVGKKRLGLPTAFHSWGGPEDDDEHDARMKIDNYIFKSSDKRLRATHCWSILLSSIRFHYHPVTLLCPENPLKCKTAHAHPKTTVHEKVYGCHKKIVVSLEEKKRSITVFS
jgi:hypothetical protein